MTESLYLNSYMRQCDAAVQSVGDGKHIILDKTIFYPKGGGQPCDSGRIIREDDEFPVVFVIKKDGKVSHEVESIGLKPGDNVRCILDWEKRYIHMRMHTAAHVLASVMHKDLGALITGNQLGHEKTRFDFSMEGFERNLFEEAVERANQLLDQDLEIKTYSLPRAKAMKIEGVVKLASALPPSVSELRIVEIPGIDIQADGGTHVKNLKEVGKIEIQKLENKGKSNRRVYFTLS
jgi:misacylated tRNA(Ala) deacylase